ncbi:protein of unknown function [Modestobacter italicus]|uniref:Uncharacterized protein n=1 Tax=Modestobacter italicus (strain DSM 44449 / CECT 9708 / BC 501) TaxID=2732864 RepID=I4EXC3_MODI5|nr:protein of unknown function [Modestobacter marinus]
MSHDQGTASTGEWAWVVRARSRSRAPTWSPDRRLPVRWGSDGPGLPARTRVRTAQDRGRAQGARGQDLAPGWLSARRGARGLRSANSVWRGRRSSRSADGASGERDGSRPPARPATERRTGRAAGEQRQSVSARPLSPTTAHPDGDDNDSGDQAGRAIATPLFPATDDLTRHTTVIPNTAAAHPPGKTGPTTTTEPARARHR